jgi:hypothetical protein
MDRAGGLARCHFLATDEEGPSGLFGVAALHDRQVVVIGEAKPVVPMLVIPLGDVPGRFVAIAVGGVGVEVAL